MEGGGNGRAVESEEDVEKEAPWSGPKRTPETLLVGKRASSRSAERGAEQLDGSAEMEEKEGDISYVPRMAAAKKLHLVKAGLKKMKKDN